MKQYDENGTEISEESLAALHRLNNRPVSRGPVPNVVQEIAIEQANMSLCLSKRGVVIWGEVAHSSQPLIMGRGYNRHSDGLMGCSQNAECKATCRKLAVHAEQVALMDALWNNVHNHSQRIFLAHVKTIDRKLTQSGSPSCVECSKLILYSPMRIAGVYLYHGSGWQFYETLSFHRQSLQYERTQYVTSAGCK